MKRKYNSMFESYINNEANEISIAADNQGRIYKPDIINDKNITQDLKGFSETEIDKSTKTYKCLGSLDRVINTSDEDIRIFFKIAGE